MEMPNDHLGELSIAKLLAGIAGSFVSLRFMAGTLLQRMTLAVGGAAQTHTTSPHQKP